MLCQSGTNKERFSPSTASDLECRAIAKAREALLSAPGAFFGISVWGHHTPDRKLFMSLSQVARSQVRSDAELFQELLIAYELVTIAMKTDETWPCVEFLCLMRGHSNFDVLRVFHDGTFERWSADEVIAEVHEKALKKQRERRQGGS